MLLARTRERDDGDIGLRCRERLAFRVNTAQGEPIEQTDDRATGGNGPRRVSLRRRHRDHAQRTPKQVTMAG